MKKWQYWILMALLWSCFLAALFGILFLLKPGRRDIPEPAATSSSAEEDREKQEDGKTDGQRPEQGDRICNRKPEQKTGKEKNADIPLREGGMAYGQADGLSQDAVSETLPPEEKGPPVLYIASDLHYQSAAATDYGSAYERFVAECDGKVVTYLPQLVDALIDEIIRARPDAFLLTGDITMNGERLNHEELAEKLRRLQDEGIPVFIIPGNHDINNHQAGLYFGEGKQEAEMVSLEEFTRIYQDFGWNQALSRDTASFSYLYPLRDSVWLMMLDTAQYDPVNLVDGAVRPETLAWMEENLKKAQEEGIQVVVSGHHNLLQESRMFTTLCVLENSREVIQLLERYRVPLYISGHLHLQRIQKHKTEPGAGEKEYGIWEIVSSALSIPPCQYGILSWREEDGGGLSYRTKSVGVSGWAKLSGQEDQNLLDFETYQKEYLQALIKAQIMEKTSRVPESTAEGMAYFYADIYADYCAGKKIDRREKEASEEYGCWERYLPDSPELKEIRAMIKDSMEDDNGWELPGENERLEKKIRKGQKEWEQKTGE